MATGTSIVGTWNLVVDWGCGGSPINGLPLTFKNDGTWTYVYGGGRWFQVEGMATWTFTNAPGLSYSGNVTADAAVGLMGYTSNPPNPGHGCFYMTRSTAKAAAEAPKAAPKGADPLVGPKK